MTDASVLHHVALAESGKVLALRGDHIGALEKYREAMNSTLAAKAPEVFFRHYLEAALESLEMMRDFDSVLQYCDKAIQHYAARPPAHELATLDLASVHQRRAVMLLKLGRIADAQAALAEALAIAVQVNANLELSKVLSGWLARGLTVTPERLLAEQRRLRYFSVRADTLRSTPANATAECNSTIAAEIAAERVA